MQARRRDMQRRGDTEWKTIYRVEEEIWSRQRDAEEEKRDMKCVISEILICQKTLKKYLTTLRDSVLFLP